MRGLGGDREGDAPVGVVLAAGLGSRLRPLTDLRPKALCPVVDVPLVDLALARMDGVVERVAVNVHAGREQMEAHLADGERPVHLSIEDELLGTAGALGALREWADGRPVLVGNADAWHRFDVSVLVDGWDGERPRLLVVRDEQRGDFGPWRYVGSALLPWEEVARLRAEPSGLGDLVWRPHAAEGTLDLVPAEGPFYDCGTPLGYLAANLEANGGHSVIGRGARVDGAVVRSVVWPHSVVRADERLIDAIRADSVTVQVRPLPW